MKKNVTSNDPRKLEIVATFKKQVVNCTKVTNLYEVGPGLFEGHCLGPDPKKARFFESFGVHQVKVPSLLLADAEAVAPIVAKLMSTVAPGDLTRPTEAEMNEAAAEALSRLEETEMGKKLRAGAKSEDAAAPKRKDGKPRLLVVTDEIVPPMPKPVEPPRVFTAEEKAFFKKLGLQEDGNTPLARTVAPVTATATTTDGKPMNAAQKAWATRRARAAAAGAAA